jgi:hypothetical protein
MCLAEEVHSKNSGRYTIPPTSQVPGEEELELVEAYTQDLTLEEFPEGPYGATTNEVKLGKTSPWKAGQQSIGRYRDANPMRSDRMVVQDEPDANAPMGTIESEN